MTVTTAITVVVTAGTAAEWDGTVKTWLNKVQAEASTIGANVSVQSGQRKITVTYNPPWQNP